MRIDGSESYVWATLSTVTSTGTAALGAVMIDDLPSAGHMAMAGAVGASAIGGGLCLLNAALPPPGDTARFTRNFVFGAAALMAGPSLGAYLGQRAGTSALGEPLRGLLAAIIGAGMVTICAGTVAMASAGLWMMFAAD